MEKYYSTFFSVRHEDVIGDHLKVLQIHISIAVHMRILSYQ